MISESVTSYANSEILRAFGVQDGDGLRSCTMLSLSIKWLPFCS